MIDPETNATLCAPPTIAVVGCGLMGSGIARALATAGYPTRVWNRTSKKARALERTPGIVAADSADEACREASLVVSVLEGYDVVRAVLTSVQDLRQKTIINLTTGTREDAHEMQQLVEAAGARYLDGTVLSYPDDIGTRRGLIVYAGPIDVFSAHRPVLMALGGASRYVSADIGGANAIAVVSAFFIAALAGFAESTSYLIDHGVELDDAEACAQSLIGRLSWQVTELVQAIRSADFATDQATIDAYASAASAFRSAVSRAGHSSTLLAATEQVLTRAQQAGFGHLAMAAVAKVDKPTAPSEGLLVGDRPRGSSVDEGYQ